MCDFPHYVVNSSEKGSTKGVEVVQQKRCTNILVKLYCVYKYYVFHNNQVLLLMKISVQRRILMLCLQKRVLTVLYFN